MNFVCNRKILMTFCTIRPLTLAVCAALPLLAQAEAEPTRTLGEVLVHSKAPAENLNLDQRASTASRLGLSVRDTPATVSVVDRDTLEKWGADSTQDMLKHVPGMTAASPPGSAGSVYYRGFGASQLTQLFNGITVQYDAIAARPVDSWIYDRVEVIGGPSTFLFGAGAVGGAINYLSKQPLRDESLLQARLSYGSFDTQDIALGLNQALTRPEQGGVAHTVRVDANQRRGQGYVDGNNRESANVAMSLLSEVNARLSHTLSLEYQRETSHRPYWGTPLLNPTSNGQIDESTRFKNYNSQDGIYQQTVKWARSQLDYQWTDATRLRNTLYHYQALRDYRNVESYRFNSSNSAVSRSSALLQRHDQDLTGNRLELTHQGTLAGLPSHWAAGFDYSVNHQTRYPLSLSPVVSTVNPTQFVTESFFNVPGMTPGFRPDRSNKVTTLALFLENRTQLGERWSLLTGLRHDQIKLGVRNHRTVSATDPAYFSQTYTPTTGRAALSYALSPSANVYVQYSTAADPPAGILTTASFSQVRDFDLTTGRQVEVGSKFDYWAGRGSATLAAYHIVRKNLAIADPNQPGVTLPVGQQSSRGIELATALRLSPRWWVKADVALVDAQYDTFTENVSGVAVSRAGKRPSNIPARVANLRVSHDLTGALQVGMDARYVSRRYADAANTISDKAYTLLGASLNYRLNKQVSLSARLNNLTDKIYAANVSTGQFYLGAPRSAEVAVQVDF